MSYCDVSVYTQQTRLCFIILLIDLLIFWLCWVLLLCGLFSSCSEEATLQLGYTGFSLRWLLLLLSTSSRACRASIVVVLGLQSTGLIVVAHELNYCPASGIFLNQGTEPESPALAGRFFSTEEFITTWEAQALS